MDLGGFAYLSDAIKHYTPTALESVFGGGAGTLISREFDINFLSLSDRFKKRDVIKPRCRDEH